MKNIFFKKAHILFLGISLCFFLACHQQTSIEPEQKESGLPDISEIKAQLPEGEGYQAFFVSCRMCHSEQYILNQPDFPEKTWASIVTKMQKTFGAPVNDDAAQEIVQYLVSIKGAG